MAESIEQSPDEYRKTFEPGKSKTFTSSEKPIYSGRKNIGGKSFARTDGTDEHAGSSSQEKSDGSRQSNSEKIETSSRIFGRSEKEKKENDTLRLGEQTVTVPKPTQKNIVEEADNMAQMAISLLDTLAVAFVGSPEAAMNDFEKLFIQGPLSQWLAVPKVFDKVAKNMTPVMVVAGLSMYGIRVSNLRKSILQEKLLKESAYNRMQQKPSATFTPNKDNNDTTKTKEGRVDPDIFVNGSHDPNVQEEYFKNDNEPSTVAPKFTTPLYTE